MRRRRPFIALALVIAACVVWFAVEKLTARPETVDLLAEDECRVVMFDVGQGDAFYVGTRENGILIDAGPADSVSRVDSELKKMGVERFDCVILSHPHEDHIGGAARLIDSRETLNVMMPDAQTNTRTFEKLLEAIDRSGTKLIIPSAGEVYEFGDLKVTVLSARDPSLSDDLNLASLVVRVEYGEVSALFTGDCLKLNEKDMLSDFKNLLDCDILKVGHHGSLSSSDEEFIAAVSPEYALISCEKYNEYGHPSASVIRTLENCGARIFRTDLDSTVILITDGKTVRIP